MKLPILSELDDPEHPPNGTCLQCGIALPGPKNEFAVLSAAAFLTGDGGDSIPHDNVLTIDLSLTHHNDADERYAVARLVRNLWGGQFAIYFCSTACLRKMLNEWVDTLEAMP